MLTATDADLEPAFRLMDFAIERGDMGGTFDLDWEPDSGHVGLRLCKVRAGVAGKGAQNSRGEDYAAPLELHVLLMDENDNVPVCPPRGPAVRIPELSPPGELRDERGAKSL